MIGFIGGTGKQGRALALRLAACGKSVILGSRSREKAARVVERLKTVKMDLDIRPATNEEAAQESDIIFITLPYGSIKPVIEDLKNHLDGKTVVDVVNPLSNGTQVLSASEELQHLLDASGVVCAFKNVSSVLVGNLDKPVGVDSIVCSDSEDSKAGVIELSERMGIPCIDGGVLENARAVEHLTRLLLDLNRRYNAETGVKVTFYQCADS